MIMNNTQYALVVGSSKIMCTFQKETDLSWQSFLQTSTKRIHSAMKSLSRVTLKNLQPDSLYQICSMMEINVEGTEESTVCTPSNNFSCDNLVHTRTCEESVPAVQNLTVHLDIEERVVLSWLPPKSKCTTLFEYRVIQLPERLSSKVSSGGRFWSNATDIVTWPTKPCIGFPERHCHLLGFTSEQIFHVQVERIQDGALSKPAVTYRRIPILGPGRPRGLEVVATRAQSLVLRWRVPLVPGPLLAHALVSVHAVEGAYVRKHSVCVRGQALMEYEVNIPPPLQSLATRRTLGLFHVSQPTPCFYPRPLSCPVPPVSFLSCPATPVPFLSCSVPLLTRPAASLSCPATSLSCPVTSLSCLVTSPPSSSLSLHFP